MADFDDELDGDDPDLRAAFRQLQHNHRMLMKEKEEVERYCQDMEETREDKERMIQQLRQHNNKLNRELGSVKDTSEQLAAHLEELEKEKRAAAVAAVRKPSKAANALAAEMQDALAGKVDMKPPDSPPPFDLGLLAPDDVSALALDQDQLIRMLRRKQRVYQREISRLRDELEAFASQNPAPKSIAALTVDESLLAAMEELDGERPDEMELSAPRAGKAMIMNARKQMEMQHSIQQTMEQRISLSRAEIDHRDGLIKSLRDELDVAVEKLREAECELERVRRSRNDPDFGMSLADEMNVPGTLKGMTYEEQNKILVEKMELKLEVDNLKEQLVDATLLATKWQWKEQMMRVVSRQRDETIFRVLEKPLNKKKQKQFLRLLKQTVYTGNEDQDSQADTAFTATLAAV